MKKKISILIFLFIILISNNLFATDENIVESQTEDFDVDNFLSDAEEIVGRDINLEDIFVQSIQGDISNNLLFEIIGKILGSELKSALSMITSILLVVIIHGILKNISSNLGNEQTGKIAYFIQIIILITMLIKIYSEILNLVKDTIESISSFVYILIPFFIGIIATTGNVTSATSLQATILVSSNLITSFINQILIPVIIIATVIGIISNISDDIHLSKISKYMKSAIIWILCLFLTIFICIVSLESNLGQGVDQVTSKATKTAVSTFVPVVGKILGDAVDSVLSCTNLVKNAVGTVGVIVVILIGIMPLIRIGITMAFFYLASGLAEVVADPKIVYVLEQMGDSCKVLLAALATVTVMLIIGITISMKIGLAI